MAYTIFNTRNEELTVVEDGTIDNTTDLKLIGKNYSGYGEIQNENFVYLLENFSGANQPPRPIAGQLWFDSTNNKIKIYDGNDENIFVGLGNVHIGPKPSTNAITASNVQKGDLWWDDVTNQLYAHNGSVIGDPFVLVGPKGAQGVRTEVEDVTVYDSLLTDGDPSPEDHAHKILKGWVDDVVVFIASNDEFTLDNSNAIAGYDRIKKGITLVNTEVANNGVTTDNYNFHGNSSNALRLGGTLAEEFVQRSNPVFVTQVDIDDTDGLNIGPNNELSVRISNAEPEMNSTVNGAKINFKVNDNTGSTVNALTITSSGPAPATDNSKNIGTSVLRWSEVHAVNFRGIADNANNVLSDGTFKLATKTNVANTLATRDSAGDLFATKFRGTATQADDATKAASLEIDDVASGYYAASVASTANRIVARDASGNVNANQFNGIATRAARVEVSTGIDSYEYRPAAVADTSVEADTVAVRDDQGRLHAAQFVGAVNGNSASADKWTTPRTLTLAGDLSGNILIDGTSDFTLTATVTNNAVQLGQDTSGNYVEHVSTVANQPFLNVYTDGLGPDIAAAEGSSIQLELIASSSDDGNKLVSRDASGDFAGAEITATTRFIGHVNQAGTAYDGWFDNLTVGTLNLGTNVTAIANGGTAGTSAAAARTNLDIYSKSEVDSAVSGAVGGIGDSDRITNGNTSMIAAENSNIQITVANTEVGEITSGGIVLASGKEFVGTATSAAFADLAEKYTTAEELLAGTVVCVGTSDEAEVEASTVGCMAVGVISTNPAFKMNSDAEGQYVALKGRVPVRVMGAVSKGQALYVHDNGCASTSVNGGSIVGIALETNSEQGEKLVECVLKV
jgi:hypothetical protein